MTVFVLCYSQELRVLLLSSRLCRVDGCKAHGGFRRCSVITVVGCRNGGGEETVGWGVTKFICRMNQCLELPLLYLSAYDMNKDLKSRRWERNEPVSIRLPSSATVEKSAAVSTSLQQFYKSAAVSQVCHIPYCKSATSSHNTAATLQIWYSFTSVA